MKEIVFDDLNTPCFRQRNNQAEDKTLEEASKKPLTLLLHEDDDYADDEPDFQACGSPSLNDDPTSRLKATYNQLSPSQKSIMKKSPQARWNINSSGENTHDFNYEDMQLRSEL